MISQRQHRALDVAKWIALRMERPELIRRLFVREPGHELREEILPEGSMRGLEGAAAAAMLHGALAKILQVPPSVSHELMLYSAHGDLNDLSLSQGWAGIGLAARYLAHGGTRYARLITAIRSAVAARVVEDLTGRQAALQFSHQYELLQGYAGLYLVLDRANDSAALQRLLGLFDWLTADGSGVRWKLPHGFDTVLPDPMNRLGMSHGIAGILGVLCCNGTTDREFDIASRIARLLRDCAVRTPFGPQWGYRLDDLAVFGDPAGGGRAGWCHYGLGIAAALLDAAEVLDVPGIYDIAAESISGIVAMPTHRWGMRDFGFCHGVGGNALLLKRAAQQINDATILAAADELTDRLLEGFDETLTLGYDAVWPTYEYSDPGLLMGSSGIALALLTLTDFIDDSWISVFALRPRCLR